MKHFLFRLAEKNKYVWSESAFDLSKSVSRWSWATRSSKYVNFKIFFKILYKTNKPSFHLCHFYSTWTIRKLSRRHLATNRLSRRWSRDFEILARVRPRPWFRRMHATKFIIFDIQKNNPIFLFYVSKSTPSPSSEQIGHFHTSVQDKFVSSAQIPFIQQTLSAKKTDELAYVELICRSDLSKWRICVEVTYLVENDGFMRNWQICVEVTCWTDGCEEVRDTLLVILAPVRVQITLDYRFFWLMRPAESLSEVEALRSGRSVD